MRMTVSGSRAGDASLDVNDECDASQNSAHSDCQFGDVFSQNYSPSSLTTDPVTDEVHDEGDGPGKELAAEVSCAGGHRSKCQIGTKEEEDDDLLPADPLPEQIHDQGLEVLVSDRLQIHFFSLLLYGIPLLTPFELFCDSFEITSESCQIWVCISVYGRWNSRLSAVFIIAKTRTKTMQSVRDQGQG